jgi:retron-type reverse transcriptase
MNKLSEKTISAIVDICTTNGGLPIGVPTSPALLNRVLLKTDEILSTQALRRGCSYSRYADDLTFSGDERVVGLLGISRSVLQKIGLELDPEKTNIFRRGRRQVCTGLVVNDKVNIPRKIRRKIRASVHSFETGTALHWDGQAVEKGSLRGRLEFLKMVSPHLASGLIERFNNRSNEDAIKSPKIIKA